MMESFSDTFLSGRQAERPGRGSGAEKLMRCLALAVVLWSLSGLIYLSQITATQPKSFMPLVMRESDSEAARTAAIETWRAGNIPTNTQMLLGDRSPLVMYNLDAELTKLPKTGSEAWPWALAADAGEKAPSFKKRLFDLNLGVEGFCRDFETQVRLTLELGIATALAGVLCVIFPRILPSVILLVLGLPGLVHFETWCRNTSSSQSPLWFFPVFVSAVMIGCLAVYRWSVAPATAEVNKNWKMFWLGLLLTAVGVAVFAALVTWGGRVRTNGLAGIAMGFGWGLYLVAVHGWQLLRRLFDKSQPTIPSIPTQPESS